MIRKIGLIALIAAGIAGCLFEKTPEYCTGDDGDRLCDTAKHTWINGPSDSGTPQPAMCTAATVAKDCKDPNLPVCGKDGRCAACDSNAVTPDMGVSECAAVHPALPFCSKKGTCVECLAAADCIKAQGTCNTKTFTCDKCVENADCASGLCENSKCADPKNLIYVDSAACATGKGMGTYEQPYCKVQDGIDHKSAVLPKTVVVRKGTYAENLSIDATAATINLVLLGANGAVLQPASGGEPALKLVGDATGINKLLATVIGFTITGATQKEAVNCVGSAAQGQTTLKLQHATIRDNTDVALSALSCDITIDQALIGPRNDRGGVSLTASDFTITNTVITKNGAETANMNPGSDVGGISVALLAKRAIVMNTSVVANSSKLLADASGIVCPGGNKMIVGNTVIFGNTGGKGGTQITTKNCNMDKDAFPGAMTPNIDLTTCTMDDLFMSDYHLKKGNAPCTLVDQGSNAPASQPAPDYDLDGNHRPAGTGFDIGAYELQ